MFLESVAFFQTELYYLRVVEMTAAGLIFCYTFLVTKDPLDCHAIWPLAHIAVNLAKILQVKVREWNALRQIKPWDREVWKKYFDDFSLSEFVALFYAYEWVVLEEGEEVITQGDVVSHLWLVYDGRLGIFLDKADTSIALLRKGQFIGEMAYFTNEPASASVRTTSAAMLIRWDMRYIKRMARSHAHGPEASAFRKLPSHFCRDLTRKMRKESRKSFALNKMRESSADGSAWGLSGMQAGRGHRADTVVSFDGQDDRQAEDEGEDLDDDSGEGTANDARPVVHAAAVDSLRREYEEQKHRLSSITLGEREGSETRPDSRQRTASAIVAGVGRRLSTVLAAGLAPIIDPLAGTNLDGQVQTRFAVLEQRDHAAGAAPVPPANKVVPIAPEEDGGSAEKARRAKFFPLADAGRSVNLNLKT